MSIAKPAARDSAPDGHPTHRGRVSRAEPEALELPPSDREFVFTRHDFDRVRRLIYERAGIHLNPGKQNMVYSRLSRRLRARHTASFSEYLDDLEAQHSDEWEAFTNALTTNLTSFFREGHHFPALAEALRTRPRSGDAVIWCSAASTGEEPYSLAITACEAFGSLRPPVRIIASDIDTQVLATAERGVYTMERAESLSPERLRKYFLKGTAANAGQFRIRPELRRMVEFRRVNLLDDAWGIPKDLAVIFCRNVLIYFDRATQMRIVERFFPLLGPEGLLFAGHSESLAYASQYFKLRGKTIYEKVGRNTP